MAKLRNLSELQQSIAFTEFDFYHHYEETFKKSELGRIKSLLPLRKLAMKFGLIEEKPKSLRAKRGRKSYFSPEGKVALMFLKMYTGLSAPKLMEALNGNIHYQIFCGVRISPASPLTNYKLIDDIQLELSTKLKIQEHYGLRKVAARIKSTETLLIFFGIHTANVVQLARREAEKLAKAA